MKAPEIYNKLVQKKFIIEMRFSHPGESENNMLDWYHVTLNEIVNKKKRSVTIACMRLI